MRRFGVLATLVLGLTLWSRSLKAGPVEGSVVGYHKLEEGEVFPRKVMFKGGQRACVIILGDRKPIVPLSLEVHDDKNNPIGKDEPSKADLENQQTPGNDFRAVIWYPPRDGEYTITIRNRGRYSPEDRDKGLNYSKCWIAIR
jgi:hypothetical protein